MAKKDGDGQESLRLSGLARKCENDFVIVQKSNANRSSCASRKDIDGSCGERPSIHKFTLRLL